MHETSWGEETPSVGDRIRQAIAQRHRLLLDYGGKAPITVEPCLLGQLNGDDALLCWQLAPPMPFGKNWRLLSVPGIRGLQVLEAPDCR